ncbi:MAG: hypothetical protein AAF460_01905 [Pseudomonadota bacterium]
MKKHVAITLLCATLATPALADEWVLGASLGLMRPGGESGDTTPAFTGSVSLGLEFLNLGVMDVGATFEYMEGLSDAEVGNRDTAVSAKAAWLTARTLGPLYLIARTGYIELDFDPATAGATDDRERALSVGLGFSVGLRSEILYTRVDHDQGDATHWLGLHWAF